MTCPTDDRKKAGGDAAARLAADRLFLYARQMGLPPAAALELCAEAFKRAGKNGSPTPATAFEEMRGLLTQNGLSEPAPAGQTDLAQLACPAFNRRSMISEDMNISMPAMLWRMITGGFAPLKKFGRKEGKTGR